MVVVTGAETGEAVDAGVRGIRGGRGAAVSLGAAKDVIEAEARGLASVFVEGMSDIGFRVFRSRSRSFAVDRLL